MFEFDASICDRHGGCGGFGDLVSCYGACNSGGGGQTGGTDAQGSPIDHNGVPLSQYTGPEIVVTAFYASLDFSNSALFPPLAFGVGLDANGEPIPEVVVTGKRPQSSFDGIIRGLSAFGLFADLTGGAAGAGGSNQGIVSVFSRAPGRADLTGFYNGVVWFGDLNSGVTLIDRQTLQKWARNLGTAGIVIQGATIANDLRNGANPNVVSIKAGLDIGAGALLAAGPPGWITGGVYLWFDFVHPGVIDSGIEFSSQTVFDLNNENASNGFQVPVPLF